MGSKYIRPSNPATQDSGVVGDDAFSLVQSDTDATSNDSVKIIGSSSRFVPTADQLSSVKRALFSSDEDLVDEYECQDNRRKRRKEENSPESNEKTSSVEQLNDDDDHQLNDQQSTSVLSIFPPLPGDSSYEVVNFSKRGIWTVETYGSDSSESESDEQEDHEDNETVPEGQSVQEDKEATKERINQPEKQLDDNQEQLENHDQDQFEEEHFDEEEAHFDEEEEEHYDDDEEAPTEQMNSQEFVETSSEECLDAESDRHSDYNSNEHQRNDFDQSDNNQQQPQDGLPLPDGPSSGANESNRDYEQVPADNRPPQGGQENFFDMSLFENRSRKPKNFHTIPGFYGSCIQWRMVPVDLIRFIVFRVRGYVNDGDDPYRMQGRVANEVCEIIEPYFSSLSTTFLSEVTGILVHNYPILGDLYRGPYTGSLRQRIKSVFNNSKYQIVRDTMGRATGKVRAKPLVYTACRSTLRVLLSIRNRLMGMGFGQLEAEEWTIYLHEKHKFGAQESPEAMDSVINRVLSGMNDNRGKRCPFPNSEWDRELFHLS